MRGMNWNKKHMNNLCYHKHFRIFHHALVMNVRLWDRSFDLLDRNATKLMAIFAEDVARISRCSLSLISILYSSIGWSGPEEPWESLKRYARNFLRSSRSRSRWSEYCLRSRRRPEWTRYLLLWIFNVLQDRIVCFLSQLSNDLVCWV